MTLFNKLNSYLRYRETLAELSRLSDRQLQDVGLVRHDLDVVARRGHI